MNFVRTIYKKPVLGFGLFLVVCSLVLLFNTRLVHNVSAATLGSSSQCYDTDVQINYQCGPATSGDSPINEYTTIQICETSSSKTSSACPAGFTPAKAVIGSSCTSSSTSSDNSCCPSNATCYAFAATECYSTVSATDGTEEWQAQDCNATIFANPEAVPLSNDLGPDEAVDQCQSDPSQCDLITNNGDGLNAIIQLLSLAAGVIIVIFVVIGGIQYSTSRDNPQATAAAKGRIVNAIVAAVMFLLLYSFLEWIVPGGFFNGSNTATPSSSQTTQ
jgi:hypothetical protein